MATDLAKIRTLQDVINVLSVVYFNMNEIERIYYDMFINPEKLYVTFQRYNEDGTLGEITLPNRAMDRSEVLTGEGSPNGVVAASEGAIYLDIKNLDLYYKGSGIDAYGWYKIYSTRNFQEGRDFLAPTGDASQLRNLNMNRATSGTLVVERGGTGSSGLTGLVKGNGSSPYTAAIEGVDYLGPTSMAGIVAYFPVRFLPDGTTDAIPKGWLRCDGSAYSRTTYARLFDIIGETYGSGNGSTTFNVPNLYNYFIRGWDGVSAFNTVQYDQVGKHVHDLTGMTEPESDHTHSRGNMNITGNVSLIVGSFYKSSGAFSTSIGTTAAGGGVVQNSPNLSFDASKSWTGVTSAGSAHRHSLTGATIENTNRYNTSETTVLNKRLIPVIKY